MVSEPAKTLLQSTELVIWTSVVGVVLGNRFVGWRVWRHKYLANLQRLWIIQMALNFSWSPVFFAAQKPALALVIILCLLLTIAVFIRAAWQSDRPSALLFAPYIAWVGFASALNAAIVSLN